MNKKPKPIPRDQRKNSRERLYSTNFPDHINDSGIKCWVPWEDYLNLKVRYDKIVKRRRKEINRTKTQG